MVNNEDSSDNSNDNNDSSKENDNKIPTYKYNYKQSKNLLQK